MRLPMGEKVERRMMLRSHDDIKVFRGGQILVQALINWITFECRAQHTDEKAETRSGRTGSCSGRAMASDWRRGNHGQKGRAAITSPCIGVS